VSPLFDNSLATNPDSRRLFVREYLGNGRARWGCFAANHTWTGPVFAKRRDRKSIGEEGTQMMARWWRREAGGVTGTCPRCAKAKVTP